MRLANSESYLFAKDGEFSTNGSCCSIPQGNVLKTLVYITAIGSYDGFVLMVLLPP
jgi:hypothetical protein